MSFTTEWELAIKILISILWASKVLINIQKWDDTAKAVGSAWFCVGLCLATQRHTNGTQMRHKCDTSATQMRHKCDTTATQEGHKWEPSWTQVINLIN
jgi:hypothetical protein